MFSSLLDVLSAVLLCPSLLWFAVETLKKSTAMLMVALSRGAAW
jgi:hypothetical protein